MLILQIICLEECGVVIQYVQTKRYFLFFYLCIVVIYLTQIIRMLMCYINNVVDCQCIQKLVQDFARVFDTECPKYQYNYDWRNWSRKIIIFEYICNCIIEQCRKKKNYQGMSISEQRRKCDKRGIVCTYDYQVTNFIRKTQLKESNDP